MNIKKHIPNFITSLGLSSGLVALYFVMLNDMKMALILLFVAAIFDFLDGAFARILNVISPMGKELDSLSDMVVFGLVPGMALHIFAISELGLAYPINFNGLSLLNTLSIVFPVLIVVFSALRLAKFNVDESQAYFFKGLPTPANALLIVSLVLTSERLNISNDLIPAIVIVLSVVSAALLVGPMKLFSLKFKDFSLVNNWYRFIFLAATIIFIIIFGFLSVPLIISFYLILSIMLNAFGIMGESKS